MVQLSHPYMATGKTIVLTIQTFVGKLTSLLSNMLPRLVIAFLILSWVFHCDLALLSLPILILSLFYPLSLLGSL